MDTENFVLFGRPCRVAVPKTAEPGRRWVWRAEFFGAFDAVDRALLAQGWHIAYCDLSDRYGCPSAVEDMKRFHDELVRRYGLSPRAALFGFSRGGLYSANYALRFPQDVAVLYLDAPVLDIRAWPGGLMGTPRAEKEWKECLACYGLTEEEALQPHAPADKPEELAGLGIPLLLIAGEKDGTVPYQENGAKLLRAYSVLGRSPYLALLKKDCDHHPHSVEDPARLQAAVRFIARFR